MNVHGWMESKGTPALNRVLHASETVVQPGAVAACRQRRGVRAANAASGKKVPGLPLGSDWLLPARSVLLEEGDTLAGPHRVLLNLIAAHSNIGPVS